MNLCHPLWSNELKEWVVSLAHFTLRASVVKYGKDWYKQSNGVPTGDSLCVQIANITVFCAMYIKVYAQAHMMQYVKDVKRFIDDGSRFSLEMKNLLKIG